MSWIFYVTFVHLTCIFLMTSDIKVDSICRTLSTWELHSVPAVSVAIATAALYLPAFSRVSCLHTGGPGVPVHMLRRGAARRSVLRPWCAAQVRLADTLVCDMKKCWFDCCHLLRVQEGLLAGATRPVLGPQWALRALYPEVRRREMRLTIHLELRMCGSIPALFRTPSCLGV
jgi:hypothetical protein